MTKFKLYEPLEDRILVKPIKKTEPETTASGLIVDMKKKEVLEGEVLNVGIGRHAYETGHFIPTVLRKGDIVLYGINQGMPIEVPNESGSKDECVVMREGDVLFLISRKEEVTPTNGIYDSAVV